VSSTEIAVVGGGIGGLTVALALARRGLDVAVFEQARELTEIGAGLHVSPNGLKVLYALGLQDDLAAVAARPISIVTRNFATGAPNFENAFDEAFDARYGAPFFSLHRADLLRILANAVVAEPRVRLTLGARAVRVDEDGAGVTVLFDDGSRGLAAAAVAADGVHSRIRANMHGGITTKFTGHVAYRGMAATAELPAGLVEPKFNIWVGPGRHFVAYPVRRGELINYVALVEEDGWAEESWTTEADKSVLAAAFEGWHETVRALVQHTLRGQCYKWALLGRDPLPYWSTERVTLLGDAAHPMVPYLAQGAVMAIEDAWVLAASLADADDLAAAFDTYERARLERTAAVQAAAWAQGQLNHSVGRGDGADRFEGGGFSDPGWIYGHDVVAAFP
jgi:salicylate hydroxylase